MQQSRYLSKTVDIKEISYSFTKKIMFATNKKQIYEKKIIKKVEFDVIDVTWELRLLRSFIKG